MTLGLVSGSLQSGLCTDHSITSRTIPAIVPNMNPMKAPCSMNHNHNSFIIKKGAALYNE